MSQTDDDGEAAVVRNINAEMVNRGATLVHKPATPKTDKISADLARELGTPAEVISRPVFERTNPRSVSAVKESLAKAKIPNDVITKNKASFEEYLQVGRDFVDYDQAVFNFFSNKGAK